MPSISKGRAMVGEMRLSMLSLRAWALLGWLVALCAMPYLLCDGCFGPAIARSYNAVVVGAGSGLLLGCVAVRSMVHMPRCSPQGEKARQALSFEGFVLSAPLRGVMRTAVVVGIAFTLLLAFAQVPFMGTYAPMLLACRPMFPRMFGRLLAFWRSAAHSSVSSPAWRLRAGGLPLYCSVPPSARPPGRRFAMRGARLCCSDALRGFACGWRGSPYFLNDTIMACCGH